MSLAANDVRREEPMSSAAHVANELAQPTAGHDPFAREDEPNPKHRRCASSKPRTKSWVWKSAHRALDANFAKLALISFPEKWEHVESRSHQKNFGTPCDRNEYENRQHSVHW